MSQNAGPKIPVEERLFSLVLALLATEHGLTKNEILSTVQGYRQQFTHSGDNSSLERRFERDKDGIRELGIPLETVQPADQSGNNQNLRYRIRRGAYELPADISFSGEELALLGLAAMVWREGALSEESRRALLKLKSLGDTRDEPVLGYQPRLRVRDSAFGPLSAALDKTLVVRFAYLKPGEATTSLRTVRPFALVQHQGRWHLYAGEVESGRTKTFLLRRIVSEVTITTETFERPEADQAALALKELDAVWNSHVASVEVQPDSDAANRLRKRRNTTIARSGALLLHYSDANIFADELSGYGPEVLVVAPPELREAVRSRLLRTVKDHSDGTDGTAADSTAATEGGAAHG